MVASHIVDKVAQEIAKVNSSLNNSILNRENFITIPSDQFDYDDQFGNEFSNNFYLINLTDSPIIYCREDNIAVPVDTYSSNFLSESEKRRYKGHVLVVMTRAINLGIMDSAIGIRLERGGYRCTHLSATKEYNEFRTTVEHPVEHEFPYQRDMTRLITDTLSRCERECVNDEIEFTDYYKKSVICKTAYVINQEGLDNNADTYIPHLDILIRKVNKGTYAHRNKVIINHQYLDYRKTPMRHPHAIIDGFSVIKGINGVLSETTYVEAIHIEYLIGKTDVNKAFIVRGGKVIELDVRDTRNPSDEGIHIYSKDETGVLSLVIHPLTEMKRFSIFKTRDSAKEFLNHDDEIKELGDKIKSQKEQQLELEIKQTDLSKEKMQAEDKGLKLTKEKNDTNAQYDGLKLISIIAGAAVSLVSAVVSLIKLFSVPKFSFFGNIFGSAN